jgi:mannitol operon transcriptional antiterminator
MTIPLTSRQLRTVEWLLDQGEPRSIAEVSNDLRLTPRVVRSGLDGIDRYLAKHGVRLNRQRGVGVWLEGELDSLRALRDSLASLSDDGALEVYAARDRLRLALFELLMAAPEPITVEQIHDTLHVSMTSARRDLARVEQWVGPQGLFLARRPGLGVAIIGTESAIRRSLVKLLLESVPLDVLAGRGLSPDWWRSPEIAAGVRRFLRLLPLEASHRIVMASDVLQAHVASGHRWLASDLAVTVLRIRQERPLVFEPGALRSLTDHPVWETAETIAEQLAELTGTPLAASEIGGITEHLLGMAQLVDAEEPEVDVELVDRALQVAAEELHPGLADDQDLAAGLGEHFERLRVRVRYGLPVHNPLLTDVAKRYPDVHVVATRIADMVGSEFGSPLSADEAGYITMYLSGSLERLRLKPRRRAVVVCPSGIATVWILVSRIQAEFPELELTNVVSAGSLDGEVPLDADVVISTVAIDSARIGVPVVVVNPLLPDDDVRRLARSV